MSLYIHGTIPLYCSCKQYTNWMKRMDKNKTRTSCVYIKQLSNDSDREFEFFRYRLYKTLEDIPRLYVIMNWCPANQLPGGGTSSILVKCLSWGFGSYFPLDEGRVSIDDVSFLEIGEPDENTVHIIPDKSLTHISLVHE